jgi:hypothetical protein
VLKAYDTVISGYELGYSDFDRFIFRHSVLEGCTAVKAKLCRFLFDRYSSDETVIYLDPDIQVFGPLTEAEGALANNDIVVTPHHTLDPVNPENLIGVMRCGSFNLGFIGLRRSEATATFLSWWDNKLERLCFVDPARGLFVDQKWMDVAVSMFPVHVLRHPGYNVAFWNIGRRPIVGPPGNCRVLGLPLRFFHFSGIDHGRDCSALTAQVPDETATVHQLRRTYRETVDAIGTQIGFARNGRETEWSYDRYHSGEPIAFDVRLRCRLDPRLLGDCKDPFAQSNEYFFSRGTLSGVAAPAIA